MQQVHCWGSYEVKGAKLGLSAQGWPALASGNTRVLDVSLLPFKWLMKFHEITITSVSPLFTWHKCWQQQEVTQSTSSSYEQRERDTVKCLKLLLYEKPLLARFVPHCPCAHLFPEPLFCTSSEIPSLAGVQVNCRACLLPNETYFSMLKLLCHGKQNFLEDNHWHTDTLLVMGQTCRFLWKDARELGLWEESWPIKDFSATVCPAFWFFGFLEGVGSPQRLKVFSSPLMLMEYPKCDGWTMQWLALTMFWNWKDEKLWKP